MREFAAVSKEVRASRARYTNDLCRKLCGDGVGVCDATVGLRHVEHEAAGLVIIEYNDPLSRLKPVKVEIFRPHFDALREAYNAKPPNRFVVAWACRWRCVRERMCPRECVCESVCERESVC
jgi:hypothetical protein